LTIDFGAPTASILGSSSTTPKNWKDVWAFRLGSQYAVTPKVDLRAGYAFDQAPAPDSTLGPELPDADRHNFSIGTGWHNDFGSMDLAYMWVHLVDRTVANALEAGRFKSDYHLVAMSVTLKF
jgi:long-chain fatty acid transport protein